jgi:hypothetical protein
MDGIYNKSAIANLVDPLKAISNVLGNKSVHVVYENEDDSMFISTVNAEKSVFAMHELKAKECIENYSVGKEELPIWDTKFFIEIIAKYQNDIYTDDVEVKTQDNKIIISCGDETSEFFLGQASLFETTRCKFRTLKTNSLTEAAKFTLDGVNLKKLLNNINVFVDQDEITFLGQEGDDHITVRLSSSSGTVFNKNESKIEGVSVSDSFEMKFPKESIKGLIGCNNSFSLAVYTGKKRLINASYEKESYKMNFYFSPLSSGK